MPGGLDEAQQVGDFEFAAARRAVALRKCFRALFVGGVVIDDQAERHVGRDHLPGGARIQQRALQPGELIGPDEIAVGPVSGLQVRTVGAAIAALVQHEDVEMRAVVEGAIDPARLDDAFAHRIHLVERARGARGEQRDVALLVGGGKLFRRRPVVGDLVVVPLHEDRHLGVEGAHIVVEEIVLMRCAEFVERLGDLGLLRDRDVLPDLAVGQFHLGGNDAVGIDGVAGMEQEIRPVLAHGGEGDACRRRRD